MKNTIKVERAKVNMDSARSRRLLDFRYLGKRSKHRSGKYVPSTVLASEKSPECLKTAMEDIFDGGRGLILFWCLKMIFFA